MAAPSNDMTPAGGYGRGVVLILLAGLLWSTMGLGVRLIGEASAFQILFYRSLGLLPVLFLYIAIASGGRPLRTLARTPTISILGGLGLVVAFGGSIISLKETTVANAVFLLSISPFFAAILGRLLLGEPVRWVTWVTMIIAGGGVAIMVAEGVSLGRLVGNVAAIVCTIGFAFYVIALRAERASNPMPVVLLGGIYATVAAATAATVAGQSLLIAVEDAAIAMGLGAVSLSGGLILFTLGSRTVPAAEATLMSLLEVVLAPLWTYLAIGEQVGPYTLVGGGILIAALVINALSGLRKTVAPEPRLLPAPAIAALAAPRQLPWRLPEPAYDATSRPRRHPAT
mgnify:CR=1 FL=1